MKLFRSKLLLSNTFILELLFLIFLFFASKIVFVTSVNYKTNTSQLFSICKSADNQFLVIQIQILSNLIVLVIYKRLRAKPDQIGIAKTIYTIIKYFSIIFISTTCIEKCTLCFNKYWPLNLTLYGYFKFYTMMQ